jgi:hypothetical protein
VGDSLNPDLAFQVKKNPDPDPDPDDQNLKNTQLKKIYILIIDCHLLVPTPPLRMSKHQEKPSSIKQNIRICNTARYGGTVINWPPASRSGSGSLLFYLKIQRNLI